MSTEMRTMSTTASKATAAKGAEGKGQDDAGTAPGKGGRKKLLLVVLVVAVAGAAAWWFLLRPTSADAATPKQAPKPQAGAVLTADAISVNLADGHYLKIGLGLQEAKGAADVTDTSKALDAVIELYSGKPMAQLSDPASRDALKKELVARVAKAYDDEVYDVYFTEYVMQ